MVCAFKEGLCDDNFCEKHKAVGSEEDFIKTIERKTGTWILIRIEENGNGLYECSECHRGEVHVPIVEVKYCWNCGTKMEEPEDIPMEYFESGGR